MPAQDAPPVSGRDAAVASIARLAARFPDLPPLAIDDADLDRREAALAHAIAQSVCRRWLTLSWLVEKASGRRIADLDAPVRAALLAGAAQLVMLDRIPPHAAISETVEWTKRYGVRKAAGLVNAVLRRVGALAPGDAPPRHRWTDRRDELPLADGRARPLAADALPADPARRLSVTASVPRALLAAWAADAGDRTARARALHALVAPPTILNTAHARGPLPAQLEPHEAQGHRVVPIGTDPAPMLGGRRDIWVQDPTSAAALALARDLAPRIVVDVCAGRGTKTRQLAAMFPSARITAAEVDGPRLRDLRAVFAGDARVDVRHARDLAPEHGGADLVLLDVPCSNTGVLARRPEARYRLGTSQDDRLERTQRDIIGAAAPLLAPGGHILYSTCSLEPQENERMVAWAEARLGLRCVAAGRAEPAGIPGDPPRLHRDGGFAALLAR